ncbi:hypothetical protein FQN55_005297 [Onygenales sp. PD_40]|nr:hypothetical protein FQN55_005297 [Onygenales sp. PD_40]
MAGAVHRCIAACCNEGAFLSFLYHTRTLTRSRPAPSSRFRAQQCRPSSRSYHSRPPSQVPLDNQDGFSALDLNSSRNISRKYGDNFSQSPLNSPSHAPSSSQPSSNQMRSDSDALESMLDFLKSVDEDKGNDVDSSEDSTFLDMHQEKRDPPQAAVDDLVAILRSVTEGNNSEDLPSRTAMPTSTKIDRLDDMLPEVEDPLDNWRDRFAAPAHDGNSNRWGMEQRIRETGGNRREIQEYRRMNQIDETETIQLRSGPDIPFVKTTLPRRRNEDEPENWHSIEPPKREKRGERARRDQAKVHAFAGSDDKSAIPGMDAYGGGKLAKDFATIAVEKIVAELSDCLANEGGDFGIWKVCEKYIFGMTKLLEEPDEAEASPAPKNDTKARVACQADSHNALTTLPKSAGSDAGTTTFTYSNNKNPLELPPSLPKRPFVFHAFPRALLYALRLLQNHFPLSEITIQLHSSIKARGRLHMLLASNTDIYNELIDYHWHVHDNLSLVVSLLEEMKVNGVSYSRVTLSLLAKIFEQTKVEFREPDLLEPRYKALRAMFGGVKSKGLQGQAIAIRRMEATWKKEMLPKINRLSQELL